MSTWSRSHCDVFESVSAPLGGYSMLVPLSSISESYDEDLLLKGTLFGPRRRPFLIVGYEHDFLSTLREFEGFLGDTFFDTIEPSLFRQTQVTVPS